MLFHNKQFRSPLYFLNIFKISTMFAFFRCEATNQANTKEPSINRVQLRVFFPPQTVEIEVERPEKNPGYDRTTDFAWITSSASPSVRKKFLSRGDDSVRIVLAGELVRLRCIAGKINISFLTNLPLSKNSLVHFCLMF